MAKKLAFVGTGQISEGHLKGVRALNAMGGGEKLRVSAVVDSFPGRAGAWVEKWFGDVAASERPVVVGDWRELLAGANRPDLVSILLPHHLHLEVGRAFLEAGIVVQMQKPIGLAIRDSRELVEVARRTGTAMAVSEPAVLGRKTRLMLEWLRSGRQIGPAVFMIDQAVIDLRGGFFMTPWRHLKGMAGAGWFIDHGVHRTHWMLEAFGECESASAQTRQLEAVREEKRWGKVAVDTEDLAAAVLRFKSGVIVQWSVMSGGRGERHHHVQVWGTGGSVRGDKCWLSGKEAAEEILLDEGAVAAGVPDDGFAHSYQELLGRMGDGKAALVGDPERALLAEAIVYACLEAAHTGAVVRVEDVVSGKAARYEETVWAARREVMGREMNGLT